MAEIIQVVAIESEDAAFALLDQTLLEGYAPDRLPLVTFGEWAHLHIELPETPISASISPSMMEAFIDLQKTIYRAYAFIDTDTGDLRTMSKPERDDLEFRVRVDGGSSNYDVSLQEILTKIGLAAVNKMTPTTIVITILGVAILVAGTVAWKAWLSSKADQRKAEMDNEEGKRQLDQTKELLAHNIRHAEILARALAHQPTLSEVDAAMDGSRQRLIRAIAEEGGGTISGAPISPEFGAEITSSRRQQSEDVRLDGVYRVARVDTTAADGFRVTLLGEDGKEVTASMRDAMVSPEDRRVIRDAEWNKRPVRVEMSGRRLRARIVDAVIISAAEIPLPPERDAQGGPDPLA